MKKSEDTSVEKSPKARRVPTKTGFKLRVALPTSQAVKGNGAVTTHARREWGASGDMKPWLPRRSPLEASARYLRHMVDAWNAAPGRTKEEHLEDQPVVLTVGT